MMGAVQQVRGVVRHYHWGDPTAIPRLLGVPEDGRPWAEIWFGGHPAAACEVVPTGRTLAELVAADATGVLGQDAGIAQGDAHFPLLLKVLAAAAPLSLQVHPDAVQAREGFAREEAAGTPLDAPTRTYRDPHPKPEMVCALTPFEAWCGVRPLPATLQLIAALDVAALGPVATVLAGAGAAPTAQADAVRSVLCALFAQPAEVTAGLVDAVVAATARLDGGPWAGEGRALRSLAAAYPGDVGVLVAVLLHHVVLQPGELVHVRPGVMHGYVAGTAVEVQAPSDNVVRCGLTSKHVDAAELLRIADTTPAPLAVQVPDGPVHHYAPPPGCPGFDGLGLARLDLADGGPVRLHGPGLLLVTRGTARLAGRDGSTELSSGQTALVRADHGAVIATGDALAHWAHTADVAGARH